MTKQLKPDLGNELCALKKVNIVSSLTFIKISIPRCQVDCILSKQNSRGKKDSVQHKMISKRVTCSFVRHYKIIHRCVHQESKQSCANENFWEEEGSTEFAHNTTKAEPLKTYSKLVNPEKKLDEMTNLTEKVRVTKFGSIRLDSDNTPRLVPQTPENTSEIDRNEVSQYVDEQYFSPLLSPKPKEQHEEPVVSHSNLQDEKLNFIDETYFAASSPKEDLKSSEEVQSYYTSEKLVDDLSPVDQEYLFPHQSRTDSSSHTASETLKISVKEEVEEPEVPRKKTALDYLESIKKQSDAAKADKDTEAESWRVYEQFLPNYADMHDDLIVAMLKKRIVYREGDIVAIDKPYGMPTMDSDLSPAARKHHPALTAFLPALAEKLKLPPGESLRPIHRLDRDTTGVLLLATTSEMARTLQNMFYKRDVTKVYWAITKGVPKPPEGVIDIPMAESTLYGRQRMNLRPIIPGRPITKTPTHKAVTNYNVLKNTNSVALVELRPETGVKHQLRAHLSLGLSCAVLGDHKFSHRDKFAPQKLPDDVLQRLHFKQSKVRHIPMHLHAGYVVLPLWQDSEKNVKISAPVPDFFRWTMKRLKLSYKLV